METHIFHIHGMHCKACILLTETEVQGLSYIRNVKSNLKHHTIDVSGGFGDKPKETIAEELTAVLHTHVTPSLSLSRA